MFTTKALIKTINWIYARLKYMIMVLQCVYQHCEKGVSGSRRDTSGKCCFFYFYNWLCEWESKEWGRLHYYIIFKSLYRRWKLIFTAYYIILLVCVYFVFCVASQHITKKSRLIVGNKDRYCGYSILYYYNYFDLI